MKTLSVEEFEAHFSEVIKEVKAGLTIAVTSQEQVLGYFSPEKSNSKIKQRKLGLAGENVSVIFNQGFKISEEEFLNP